MWYEPLLENGLLPDAALRVGIRGQLRARLKQQREAEGQQRREAFLDTLATGPIATHTTDANEQHYEVPTEFYQWALGPRWKYSSGYWRRGSDDLASSEEAMLNLYVERARLQPGHRILDLGCGWGSLTLYLAARFPTSDIVAVSNSSTQRRHIERRCAERELDNVTVITCDINDFEAPGSFDRVLSIEMFEHMSNYRELLQRISGWLADDGFLFVHHFAHRDLAYPFDAGGSNEWMAKHFFSGGIMPSAELLGRFPEHLAVVDSWEVNGRHYQRTCEAWLRRMSIHRTEVMRVFADAYGPDHARKHFNYWRIFFMACAELFGFHDGKEWFVVHSLMAPRNDGAERTL